MKDDRLLYLYHTSDSRSGIGRWIVGHSLFSDSTAVQFIESYAILPHLTQSSADKSTWAVPSSVQSAEDSSIENSDWQADSSVFLSDTEDSNSCSFYFESATNYQLELSGFYVRRYSEVNFPITNIIKKHNTKHFYNNRRKAKRSPYTLIFTTKTGARSITSTGSLKSALG